MDDGPEGPCPGAARGYCIGPLRGPPCFGEGGSNAWALYLLPITHYLPRGTPLPEWRQPLTEPSEQRTANSEWPRVLGANSAYP